MTVSRSRQPSGADYGNAGGLPALLLLFLLLPGCATVGPEVRETREAWTDDLQVDNVPFHPDDAYYCGPAAVATVLGWDGAALAPEDLAAELYVPERRGSLQTEVMATARAHGRLAYRLAPDINDLLAELAAGRPVLVLQNLGLSWAPTWHYAVVVAYEPDPPVVILRSGERREHRTPLATFLRTWQRAGQWALIVLPPGEMPANPVQQQYRDAAVALERHGDAELSLRAYRAGRSHWPRDPVLAIGEGNMLYAQARWEEAVNTYREASRMSPEDAVLHHNLARALMRQERLAEAETALARALELGGPFADHFRRTHEELLNRQ